MDEEKIKLLIKEYIKNNLTIEITTRTCYDSELDCRVPESVEVAVNMCGETVSTSYDCF